MSFLFRKLRPGTVARATARARHGIQRSTQYSSIRLQTYPITSTTVRSFSDMGHSKDCIVLSANAPESSTSKMQLSPATVWHLHQHVATGEQNAFYVVDTSAVETRLNLWKEYLPQVRPFYAVKCNPDTEIVRALKELDCGFDCASLGEIEAALKHGAHPEDIIYANPLKQPSHIAHAASKGVDMMTFDSVEELEKIKAIHPSSKLVLRLYVDDSHSVCQLGTKFGAMLHDVPELLRKAQELELNVIGASFHVGSGCYSAKAFSDAVVSARQAFDIGASMGMDWKLLDIGGGFPGSDNAAITFEDCATELQQSLATHFPSTTGITIISEPGRFFAESTHTLAVNVIGKKKEPNVGASHDGNAKYMYFVNDGLYGSFNCLVYDHAEVQPVVLSDEDVTEMQPSSLWGPTCDGLDCIAQDVRMPLMEIGQWICFPNLGAYTSAAASNFNGFVPPKKVYFDGSDPGDKQEAEFVH